MKESQNKTKQNNLQTHTTAKSYLLWGRIEGCFFSQIWVNQAITVFPQKSDLAGPSAVMCLLEQELI